MNLSMTKASCLPCVELSLKPPYHSRRTKTSTTLKMSSTVNQWITQLDKFSMSILEQRALFLPTGVGHPELSFVTTQGSRASITPERELTQLSQSQTDRAEIVTVKGSKTSCSKISRKSEMSH